MAWLSRFSEEEIEQALAGEYSGDDASLADLAAFARDAKSRFAASPDVATRAAHMVAVAEAAADLDGAQARASEPAPSPSPFRKVKLVLSSLFASLVAKIALVGVALAATTGGLAATGSLPQPAQEALARASEKVGFELPAGHDREESSDDDAGVPEQLPEGTEGSSAPSVLDVIRSWGDDKGCEFGHAVATAAGGDPGPCKDQQGGDDDDSETTGKPDGTPNGKPDGAGKPEGTPQGKPAGAGRPEGTPGGGSDRAGEHGSDNADRGGGSNGSADAGPPSSVPGGKP